LSDRPRIPPAENGTAAGRAPARRRGPRCTPSSATAAASRGSWFWRSKYRARGCGVPTRAWGTARGTSRSTASADCSGSSSWDGRPG